MDPDTDPVASVMIFSDSGFGSSIRHTVLFFFKLNIPVQYSQTLLIEVLKTTV